MAALTRNPVFSFIPAFSGMTPFVAINVVMYHHPHQIYTKSLTMFPLLVKRNSLLLFFLHVLITMK